MRKKSKGENPWIAIPGCVALFGVYMLIRYYLYPENFWSDFWSEVPLAISSTNSVNPAIIMVLLVVLVLLSFLTKRKKGDKE